MSLFYAPDITATWELPEEEAAHALRVLRSSVGDEHEITDGKGHFYKTKISSIVGKHCYVEALETISQPKGWSGRIHLAIAPTKNIDRIEWLLEKITEIGIDEVTFVQCRYSERKVVKNDRLERIVISAMKQSLKAYKPLLNEMIDFGTFVGTEREGDKFIAHCYDSERTLYKQLLTKGRDVTILIGPEGDFSTAEVDAAIKAGYRPVSLGSSRLRTETAGLVACHTFNLLNEI